MSYFKPLRRKIFTAILLALMVSLVGWRILKFIQFRERKHQIESRGAMVMLAGYSTLPRFVNRLPFVGNFFVRSQIEVWLPSTEVANSVQELLRDFPECKRIWIHIDNVTPETHERIRSIRPDVKFVRYD